MVNKNVKSAYADGHLASSWEYPKNFKISSIDYQIQMIEKMFDIDGSQAREYIEEKFGTDDLKKKENSENLLRSFVPEDFVGNVEWYAFPKISVLGKKYFPDVTDYAILYYEVTKLVYKKLNSTRTISIQKKVEQLSLRQVKRTMKFLEMIESQQKGDIILIACQHGICRRGESVAYASNNFFQNEFGICAFGAACMALTNPSRYAQFDELDSICPGTEYSECGGKDYNLSIMVNFLLGKSKILEIDFISKKYCYAYRGQITGFAPSIV